MGCRKMLVYGSTPGLIVKKGKSRARTRREQTTKKAVKVVVHKRAIDAGWWKLENAISPSLHSHGHDPPLRPRVCPVGLGS